MSLAVSARNMFKHRAWHAGNILCGYFYFQRTLSFDISPDISRQKDRLQIGKAADRISQSKSELANPSQNTQYEERAFTPRAPNAPPGDHWSFQSWTEVPAAH